MMSIEQPPTKCHDTNNNSSIENDFLKEIENVCRSAKFIALLAEENICFDDSDGDIKNEKNNDKMIVLPKAEFMENSLVEMNDTIPLPDKYYVHNDKLLSKQEHDVEYDLDEEDLAWLSIINEHMTKENKSLIDEDLLETAMDMLEKLSYSWKKENEVDADEDEDVPCCICLDDECSNTNAILFCDRCNMAVHQDCYGIPYVPEGQWFCRRCIHSPNENLICCLCPNFGGAFKQTDDGRWAHVVCALWIPEVRFANLSFLEPIDCIERIPQERWELSCRVCRKKNVGAAIQCDQNYCISAFHATCGLMAGLSMTITEEGNVTKTAFCDICTYVKEGELKVDDDILKIYGHKSIKTPDGANKNNLDFIPENVINKIKDKMDIKNTPIGIENLKRILAYWVLKRQSRNGTPLIKRLQ